MYNSADTSKEVYKIHYLNCPTCRGQGLVLNAAGEVVTCPECYKRAMQHSVWGFWNGQFLHWGKRIDALSIIEDRTKKTIRAFINMVFFVFGVIGLLLGLWEIFLQINSPTFYWTDLFNTRNFRTVIFWLSLATDMYIYYRLVKESEIKHVIRKQTPQAIALPENVTFRTLTAPTAESARPKQLNISTVFDHEALAVIENAWDMAHEFRHYIVSPTHLLNALLRSQDTLNAFARLDVYPKSLIERITR